MSALAEALGNAGQQHTIEWEGKTLKLNYFTQAMKVQVEKFLFEKDLAKIKSMREALGEEGYRERLQRIEDQYDAGYYSMSSPKTLEWMKSDEGSFKMAALIVGVDEMELIKIHQSKGDELILKIKLVMKESFNLEKTG